MKSTLLALGVLTAMSVSSAFASLAGFSSDDLLEATRVSIQDFKTSNPDHAEHVSGFKSWQSGTDAKVKLYVAHDGMTMAYDYDCAKHGTDIHCNAVQ